MQINITGHGLDITDALKLHVSDKLERIKHHFDHITSVHVVLRVEKLLHFAEATVLVAKKSLHASAEDTNMYTAIDQMADMLDKQLIKHKEKLQQH